MGKLMLRYLPLAIIMALLTVGPLSWYIWQQVHEVKERNVLPDTLEKEK